MIHRLTVKLAVAAACLVMGWALSDAAPRLPKGCTVYGTVICDGVPVKGAVVSDGDLVTVTDAKGRYFLNSTKRNGSVFVSLPSGTEPAVEHGMPRFWEALSQDIQPEQHDFSLHAVDNQKHAVIAVSDLHMANVFDDQRQFDEIFMPRIMEEVEKYRSQGIRVYCVNGGDSSYDRYWYEDLYTIADFPVTLSDAAFPVPMFCAMGNHDNDGATPYDADTDFNASAAYRRTMGPTHYSFNLGSVHYVVLDDIVYKNSPGRIDSYDGITGKRDYDVYVTDDQLEWLARDLALVTDRSTPIVITMHSPLLFYKGSGSTKIVTKFRVDGVRADDRCNALLDVLKDYEAVHFITGHTHKNLTCHGADDTRGLYPNIANVIDHNITGACGCWWQTRSHNGLSLAPDSGPAGFEVFPVDGRDIRWYFVSNDDGAARQFRVFDMNGVRDFYRRNGEMRSFIKRYPGRTDYSQIEDNWVYIHVWAWETDWKISVTENGQPLEVVMEDSENPQFTVSHHLPRASWDDNGVQRWQERYNKATLSTHFFRVRATAPDTTLEVSVTDGFGQTWTQTVTRPKAFSKMMR